MFKIGIIDSPTITYILDVVTGSQAAHSLRKLKWSAWLAIRVRRSSDNTEQDIWFQWQFLDSATLLTFCSWTNGFITTYYDQTWNNNHFIMATAAAQPQIVTAWALTTTDGVNSRPASQFTASSDQFMTLPSWFLNAATALSIIGVWNIDLSTSNSWVFWPSTTSGTGIQIIANESAWPVNDLKFNATTGRITATNQLFTNNTHFVTEVYADNSSISAFQNNVATTLASSAAMPTLTFNGLYWLARYGGSGNDVSMKFQEMIIFTTKVSASRATLYANISAFYW